MKAQINSTEVYTEKHFTSMDLSRQEIVETEFAGCWFKSCTLRETVFSGCHFDECIFEACDLSMMKVSQSQFMDCKFTRCQLVGINWTEMELSKSRLKAPFSFEGCVLNHSTFIGMPLKDLVMKDCTARNVDFSESVLQKADLRGTDLAESRFAQTDLGGVDLRGTKNYAIDPNLNTIKGAHFALPEALSLLYSMDIVLDE